MGLQELKIHGDILSWNCSFICALCVHLLLIDESVSTICLISTDYLPVYFQASKGASAIGSGVDMFAFCLTIPAFAIATGLSVEVVGLYRPQNYLGWAFLLIGFGLLTRLDQESSRAAYIASQAPLGVGIGVLWISTAFPILAPLPVSNSAHAVAFFMFMRSFAQVRETSVSKHQTSSHGAIFNTELGNCTWRHNPTECAHEETPKVIHFTIPSRRSNCLCGHP